MFIPGKGNLYLKKERIEGDINIDIKAIWLFIIPKVCNMYVYARANVVFVKLIHMLSNRLWKR